MNFFKLLRQSPLSARIGMAMVLINIFAAIFAPVKDLGLIVIDEEHEGSYKQDTVPRYHG